jgi:hypothetical protein
MNISKEADAAFLRELEHTDPQRYSSLMRNMRLAAGAISLARRQHGGRPRKYKSNAARQRAYRRRNVTPETVTKPGAGPFIPQGLQMPFQAPATPIA